MSSTAVTPSRTASALRDPVLLVPAVVAAGLARRLARSRRGRLGRARGRGPRAGVGARRGLPRRAGAGALAAIARPARRRRVRAARRGSPVGGCACPVDARLPARQRSGWRSSSTLVLTFPEGRAWSRAARVAIAGAYVGDARRSARRRLRARPTRATCSRSRRSRRSPTPSTGRRDRWASPSRSACSCCVVRRLRVLRGPARRAQAPLLAGAGLAVLAARALAGLGERDRRGRGDARDDRSLASRCSFRSASSRGSSWSRLRRSEASDLVVELRTEGATSLRERLARVLGDPTLDVAYRLDDGRYVDAAGRPLELPQGPERAITLVTARGEEVAALVHDPALLDEPALVESVRATAGLVLENERLAAEVRVAARRGAGVARAGSSPRPTPSGGESSAISTTARSSGSSRSPSRSGSRRRADAARDSDVLARAQDEVDEAIAELRELARGIHPTLLRDEGLAGGGRGARAADAAARDRAKARSGSGCPTPSSSPPTSSSPRR